MNILESIGNIFYLISLTVGVIVSIARVLVIPAAIILLIIYIARKKKNNQEEP